MESHAHPTTTAIQIPKIPSGNTRPPKNPSTTARPLTREISASIEFRRDSARAAKKQLIARKVNPRAPAAKWASPVALIEVGNPLGVPGGKPSTGSARKIAATSMDTPKLPKNHVTSRDFCPSTRPNPIAAATTIKPVSTKFAVCIHPPGPFANRLSGCRPSSKPSRRKA